MFITEYTCECKFGLQDGPVRRQREGTRDTAPRVPVRGAGWRRLSATPRSRHCQGPGGDGFRVGRGAGHLSTDKTPFPSNGFICLRRAVSGGPARPGGALGFGGLGALGQGATALNTASGTTI